MPNETAARSARSNVTSLGLLWLALTAGGTAGAASPPANTLRELFVQLDGCLRVATSVPRAQITVRFALKRDGSLLGRPKVTFSKLPTDAAARETFVAAVAQAFGRCLPARITAGLGGAVTGRPLTIRVVVKPPETKV